MESPIVQSGSVIFGVLALATLVVRETFRFLLEPKTPKEDFNEAIFNELKRMNNNHLHSVEEAIKNGNYQLIETIHNDNTKMIEILGEIKGRLR